MLNVDDKYVISMEKLIRKNLGKIEENENCREVPELSFCRRHPTRSLEPPQVADINHTECTYPTRMGASDPSSQEGLSRSALTSSRTWPRSSSPFVGDEDILESGSGDVRFSVSEQVNGHSILMLQNAKWCTGWPIQRVITLPFWCATYYQQLGDLTSTCFRSFVK